jgi:hypothetical protein
MFYNPDVSHRTVETVVYDAVDILVEGELNSFESLMQYFRCSVQHPLNFW